MPQSDGSVDEHPALVLVFEIGPDVPGGITLSERHEIDKVTLPSEAHVGLRVEDGIVIELRDADGADGASGTVRYRRRVFGELVLVDHDDNGVLAEVDDGFDLTFDLFVPQRDGAAWIDLLVFPDAVPSSMAVQFGLDPDGGMQRIGRWPYQLAVA